MLQLGLAANNRAELRGYPGVTADVPILIGGSASAPMTAEVWVWDPLSMVADDGITTLLVTVQSASTPGRFVRLSVCGSASKTFNNSPGRSIVTGTGSTGFQPSALSDSNVNYSISINTSVSLSGNSSGYVVLEICPTNSATPSAWIEIGRVSSGQSGTLVVGLVLNQVGGGQIGGVVPAGYYAKIRTVNVSGTPTYVINSQQEVLL
jgi:hypothetical protein